MSVWEICLEQVQPGSPGSASALRGDARAASQTVISQQYFQAAFLCKQGKIRYIKTPFLFSDTTTQPFGRQWVSLQGGGVTMRACAGTMLHRDALWDDNVCCIP